MFSNTTLLLTAPMLVAFGVLMTSQEPTLIERAEASGGRPLTIRVLRETVPISIEALSAQSDLVVVSRLVRLQSYLSENKKQIFTDYVIVPSKVLLGRIEPRPTPGPTPRMVLTVLGGQINVRGTLITMVNEKSNPIKNEGEFLLFASRVKGGENRFYPTQDSAGLFEIRDGQRVQPLFRRNDVDPEVEGVPFEAIARKIQAGQRR
jgi:hypothetical protein